MSDRAENVRAAGDGAGRILRPWRLVIALVLAVAASLWVYDGYTGVLHSWSQFRYAQYFVFDPASGFPSLVLALFVLFAVPGMLVRLGSRRRIQETRTRTPSGASSGGPGASTMDEELLRVPSTELSELGAEHRWQMAQALGIPWRDELIVDAQGWAAACCEAAEREADGLRQ